MESGLILADFCERYRYAIPFTPKPCSVKGVVGLKFLILEKPGLNIPKCVLLHNIIKLF